MKSKMIFTIAAVLMVMPLLNGITYTSEMGTITDSLKTRHYTLEALRVNGLKPSETIGAVSITNLDAADKSGSLNVKEVMTNLPGISMTVGTKDESNLRIRGFRKNEVKILIDGRPLNSGYFGNVNLQNIAVSDIQEVQILKGPASAMYGSNTLGGVVNLITRDPSDRKWFKLGMTWKRNNTNHFELSISHQFAKWNYWLFTSRDHTDGFMLPVDFKPAYSELGGVRNNSSKNQRHLEGKSTFNISDFHTLTVTAGVTSIPEKYLPSSIYETSYRKYKDWLRFESTLRSDLQLSPDMKLQTMLYIDGGKDTYQEFNDPFFEHLAMDSDMKNFTIGINPHLNLQVMNGSRLSFGYRGESQFSSRKDNGNYLVWTDHSTHLHNLFTQMEWKIATSMMITGSTGLSYFLKDAEATSVQFEPSIGWYYEFGDHTSLSASVGRNTAFPTMRQLFSFENGNIDLRPQNGIKYELTGKQSFRINKMYGILNVNIYLNDVRDLVDIVGETYWNIYQVRSQGGEVKLEFNPSKWWNMDYSYSYLDYTRFSSYRLTESPKNAVDLNWALNLPRSTTLSISTNWKDLRYSTDSSYRYHILESYWIHNFMIRKEWKWLKASFGLENFTDANYQEEYGFPAAGINFSFRLEKEF